MEKKARKNVLNRNVENSVGNVENLFRNSGWVKKQKIGVFHAIVEKLKTC